VSVTGTSTLAGLVQMGGSATVAGGLAVVGTSTTAVLSVTGTSTMAGAVTMGGALAVTGALNVTGTSSQAGVGAFGAGLSAVGTLTAGAAKINGTLTASQIFSGGTGDINFLITPNYSANFVVQNGLATLTVGQSGNLFQTWANAPFTITLPTATGNSGIFYDWETSFQQGGAITFNCATNFIEGPGARSTTNNNFIAQPINALYRIFSDGSNWNVAVLSGQVGSYPSQVVSRNGTATFNSGDYGSFNQAFTGGPYAYILPNPTTGATMVFQFQFLTGNITFSTVGGTANFNGPQGSSAATLVVQTSASQQVVLTLVGDGTNWNVYGSSNNPSYVNESVTGTATAGVLSVTGTSTQAGAVAMGAGLNVVGTSTFTKALIGLGMEALYYLNTSAQAFGTGSAVITTGWTKGFDRLNANFNAATGVYTAPVTGYYMITGQTMAAAGIFGGALQWQNQLIASGGQTLVAPDVNPNGSPSFWQPGRPISGVFFLTAGQTVHLSVIQSLIVGATMSTVASQNYFTVAQIP
jgi:hypothetical protein